MSLPGQGARPWFQNAQRYDLSDPARRMASPFKAYPHFEIIRRGRHLGYLKRPGAATTWIARVTLGGCRFKQQTLGRCDDTSVADGDTVLSYPQALDAAEKWFRHIAGKVGAIDPAPLGRARHLRYSPVGSTFTVAHALDDLMKWKKLSCSQSHLEILYVLINHHILDRIGIMPVDEISGQHARAFIQLVLETPPYGGNGKIGYHWPVEDMDDETRRKQRNTANTIITILRQAFLMAWEDGKTDNERAWRVFRRIRNVYRPRIFHLSRPEVRALLAAAGPQLTELLLGALYTGCRIGELLALTAADVGRDGYGIYVRPAKTFKARFVFLADEGMAFFRDIASVREPDEALFWNSGPRPWSKFTYTAALKDAAKSADLPDDICWHALRHTYASQLVQSGAPYIVVSEQLGHSNPVTVMRTYAHLSPQIREAEVRQRFSSISDQFSALASEQKNALQTWRESLHGGPWRSYATIDSAATNEVE